MAKGYPTELRRAFLGGIGGAGAYYLMFGEYWILQTVFAIGGAWLAHYLVHQAMNRPSSSPKQ